MAELLTAAQMKALEQAAMASGAVTGLELMERAGRGVVEAVFAEWPALRANSYRAVVLCGPGNNGGDGFVVARLLVEWGWQVEVFLLGDPTHLPPDARANFQRWLTVSGKAAADHAQLSQVTAQGQDLATADLIVDAMFGTGLVRPLADDLADAVRLVGMPSAHSVSIDIPSGLCSDSGRVIGARACTPDLTVTFHSKKPGHLLASGPEHCGRLVVTGIGLEGQAQDGLEGQAPGRSPKQHEVGRPCRQQVLGKARQTHKYDHGHALILSGPMGRTGAARLAARAALRVGAGAVTVAAPGSAMMECAAQLTAVMLRKCDDDAALEALLGDNRLNALCLGPGLGVARARALVPVALGSGRGVVLDADALSAFEDDPQALFSGLHPRVVLTPHAGEFGRLFPDIAEKLAHAPETGPAFSKLDATREAAARAGCTILFKGADTVIADPDGAAWIHCAGYDRAAPWLATAGSGDVLAGLIVGLMARGLDGPPATRIAAWLHVEAALAFGPGLIAEDLTEALPAALRGL